MTDEMMKELESIPGLLDFAVSDLPVEVRVRQDGEVLWINVGPKCVLRICGIKEIVVEDDRPKLFPDDDPNVVPFKRNR